MHTFHWTSLAAAGLMVTALLSTALWMPVSSGTKVAMASFVAPSQTITQTASTGTLLDNLPTAGRGADKSTSADFYAALNYDLDAVLQGHGEVPRLTLVSLPGDLARIRKINERKAVFFKTVLPLVLQINEKIAQDRVRIKALSMSYQAALQQGTDIKAEDRLWLAVVAARYGLDRYDFAGILNRHDGVPPSLALAQAATESAWGTSRFVREGNAMFGEWTFRAKDKGIIPAGRTAGKTHRIRAFDSLYDSVYSYVINLNRHRAYKEYRDLRFKMRAEGKPLDGLRLAGALYRYSERGAVYVAEIRAIISGNELDLIDGARLSRVATLQPLI